MGPHQFEDDAVLRQAAFEHVLRLAKIHGHLTARELNPGFSVFGKRIPLVNPHRGIFKPQQLRFLLSIRTVFPRPGGRIWYDDQREVHRQIFKGEEAVDYAFMGTDPNAADNRWRQMDDVLTHDARKQCQKGSM
jgi:putative restriction endonuclease